MDIKDLIKLDEIGRLDREKLEQLKKETETMSYKAYYRAADGQPPLKLMRKTLSQKLEQLEREANIAPGKLESALICAFCLAATPVLLIIAVIIH